MQCVWVVHPTRYKKDLYYPVLKGQTAVHIYARQRTSQMRRNTHTRKRLSSVISNIWDTFTIPATSALHVEYGRQMKAGEGRSTSDANVQICPHCSSEDNQSQSCWKGLKALGHHSKPTCMSCLTLLVSVSAFYILCTQALEEFLAQEEGWVALRCSTCKLEVNWEKHSCRICGVHIKKCYKIGQCPCCFLASSSQCVFCKLSAQRTEKQSAVGH